MRRLAWAFAGCLSDKYPFLLCKLKYMWPKYNPFIIFFFKELGNYFNLLHESFTQHQDNKYHALILKAIKIIHGNEV